MNKKKFEKNITFMILNYIIFFVVAWLLRKIPFVTQHDILGTILYILLLIISAVIIYNFNFFIYKKIINKNQEK